MGAGLGGTGPLPVKLQYNGAVDDGKTHQPDPAESDAAEYTGLEVQDEDLARRKQKQLLCAAPPLSTEPVLSTLLTLLTALQ